MAIKSQGTRLYTVDPATHAVLVVGCVTGITGIDTSIEQNEITCLEDSARRYMAGLATPGAANFTIQFDPSDDSHVRLHQLKVAGTTLPWAIGFSDGTAPPVSHEDSAGEDGFTLPTSRSWITFEGYMNSFPFDFAINTPVTSNVGIQVSGEPAVSPKV
jgi:hypothetical protein